MSKATYKLGIEVMPRAEVLDTQGRAVQMTVQHLGYPITNCRVGRFVNLSLQASNKDEAQQMAKKISETVLCNTLIETFEILQVEEVKP